MLLLSVLACSFPSSGSTTKTSSNATAQSGTPDLSQQVAVDDNGYPKAPEGVVRMFLTAYTLDTEQMKTYLSANRLANLPDGGPLAMLKLNGTMEGFVIESAAVSPGTSAAQVVVRVRSGGGEETRTFKLVLDGQKWAIDAIEGGQ